MNNLRASYLLRSVAIVILTLFIHQAQAQVQTPRYIATGYNSNGFLEYLPAGYNTNTSQSYPLIIFMHGISELGNGDQYNLPRVAYTGLPAIINWGQFPQSFTVNGRTFSFIVISPQFINWPGPADIDAVINYAVSHYRVDASRIYLTGLSMGGGVVWDYAGASVDNGRRVAAIVPICGASWPDFNRARTISAANLPVWALHNNFDPTVNVSYTNNYVDYINQAPSPTPLAKKSLYDVYSHDAWTDTYNGNHRDETGKSIFEWMLQYSRGNTGPVNQAPTVNAGGNQNITTSTVNLSGSATDADGSIASYSWSKISGPSSFSFSNTAIANPTVSNLTTGSYVFRLTATDNGGASSYSDVTINVTVPVGTVTLPGRVEAEAYSAMSGIQIENTNDAGGGQDVGWQDNNDWMDYNITAPTAGTYTVNFRVASMFSGAQFQLRKADGTVLTTVTVPNTGNFQTWQTVSAQVLLTAGQQNLRIYTSNANGGWNFNWMEFASSTTSTGTTTSTFNQKIEAENFTAQSGIQTENTNDAGGGLDVGWQDNNDWMDYSVSIPSANTYTLSFRVASMFTGATFQVRNAAGTALATVTVPNTGNFQTWQTVTAQVSLPAGQQTLRLVTTAANGGWNINWWQIAGTTTTTAATTPTNLRIEAENFSAMNGIQTENTSDAGGGRNVGWQDNNDWMDYSVNLPSAATYNLNFRVASMFTGAQFQLRAADGTVLTTVTVPNTGNFQTWQTVSAQVSLPAGQQTLRIVTTNANGGWNFNWWEINSATTGTARTASVDETAEVAASLEIFPNPVADRFALKVDNAYTGTLKVEVIDMSGAVQKTFNVKKAGKGTMQTYLSLGSLQSGQYLLKATMNGWSETSKLVKQ